MDDASRVTIVDRYPEFISLMEAVLAEQALTVTGLDVDETRADDVARTTPDLVILRIGPLEDDPARRLYVDARRHAALADIPFVLATSGVETLPPAAGAEAVIRMPFDIDHLLLTVGGLLQRGRSARRVH